MTRPITGRAEAMLEYPDKVLIGTFAPADQCDARFEANDVLLTLQRTGDAGGCHAMHLHLDPPVFAEILRRLAGSVSTSAPDEPDRAALRAAAGALERALAALPAEPKEPAQTARGDDVVDLTPEEEVLLLHVME